MNEQRSPKGIEWTRIKNPDGTFRRGFTWNPVAGCKHRCQWQMPDGSIAICYAESIAEGLASASYPEGFAHHYWHETRLDAPLKVKEPAGIFLDSQSDLMGTWVPDEQIRAVLDVVRQAHWHTFQLLTKNAPRLLKFADEFPPNLWVGVSMPPTFMFGRRLSEQQQQRMFKKSLDVLADSSPMCGVTWVSLEPLSFDVSDILWNVADVWHAPEWLVIGAASSGRKTYQPNPLHVERVLDFADRWEVPVFFKGNLDWEPHRAEFPQPVGRTERES